MTLIAATDDLLASMTLAEKVGQMTQIELNSITPDEVAAHSIGSVLSGGGGNPGDGTPAAWRSGVEAFVDGSRRSRLGIPLLYGVDAVHGHNNVRGATIFPHNIGLGASRDTALVEQVSRAAALETAATGVRWSFAPCLAVPRDHRWGRTYEGFSSDPAVVAELGAAAVRGWHGSDLTRDGVAACAKHFVGEGDMVWGSAGRHRHPWVDWWNGWGDDWQIDQGDIEIDEAELRAVHLPAYAAAIEAGVMTVMACYASWKGDRLHGHRYLLTDVLKGELAFDGFVVSDWMAADQIDADYATAMAASINAGVDMMMVPFDHGRFITTVVELVEAGRVPVERIDDAVARILSVKARLGLFDPAAASLPEPTTLGRSEHRELARRAVHASTVVLADDMALPISREDRVIVAGAAADDVGRCCGGWTISWEGGAGPITPGSTVLDGLVRHLGAAQVQHSADAQLATTDHAEVGVVTVHEEPYVEGQGDRADLSLPDEQVEVVRRLRQHVDRLIVVVVSGRPVPLGPIIDLADAIVAAWLPGSESDGVADVLVGAAPSTGRLPVPWPSRPDGRGEPRWPLGHAASSLIRTLDAPGATE